MEIELKNANCTALSLQSPVLFAPEDTDHGNGFEIEAYSGAVVDRWWGKLAIALDGIKAKKQIPVLMNHNPDQIVGYSKDTRLDGSFYVTGIFSGVTDSAREAKGLAAEGFPWQASIGVRAKKILSLEENSEHFVNGVVLKGPAEVWLESEVFETSFVPLGADTNTSIATFSKFDEKEKPAPVGAHETHEEVKLMEKITIAMLEKEAPEILAEITATAKANGIDEGKLSGFETGKQEGIKEGLAQGAKAERERIEQVLEQAIPGHEAMVQKLAFDGKTTGPEAAVQVLAAEKKLRVNAHENLNADAIDPVDNAPAPATPPAKADITKETFSQHKDLYEEFGGDFEAYQGYKYAIDNNLVKKTKEKV